MAEIECPNCFAHRSGAYCQECGQNDRDFMRSLPPVVGDLLREAFELDGRLVQSLKLLLFRPGQLSLEFSNNRRASYISPVRLYLFASLAFFFSLSLAVDFNLALPNAESADFAAGQDSEDASSIARLRSFVEPERLEDLNTVMERDGSLARAAIVEWADGLSQGERATTPPGETERYLLNRVVSILAAPQRTVGVLIDNLPFAVFFLLPAFAGLLKLLYVRSRRYYVEHLVFALHLHSFLCIVATPLLWIPEDTQTSNIVGELLNWVLLIYGFLALHTFYQQGWVKTVVKGFLLMIGYSILLAPSVVLVGLLTLTMS